MTHRIRLTNRHRHRKTRTVKSEIARGCSHALLARTDLSVEERNTLLMVSIGCEGEIPVSKADLDRAAGILGRLTPMVEIPRLTVSALTIQPDEREAARNEVIEAAKNWRRTRTDLLIVRYGHEIDLVVALAHLDAAEAKEPTS